MEVGPHVSERGPVAVVVASRDRVDMLDRCLTSVRDALAPGDELVVVDSASCDHDAYVSVARTHGALLVRCDEPGVNRARNAGWRASRAPVVLFTDDDVEVERGWADAYAACLDEHPEIGFVTGWIGVPDGQEDTHDVAVKDDVEPAVLDRSTRGSLGHGASLAVRREALERLGGWDEALGAGGRFRAAPEVDLFDRLLAAGWTGRFAPTARARHHQWRTDGQLAALHLRYGLGTGARIAKLHRTDRSRMRHVIREAWWDWGIHDAWLHLRYRDARRLAVALLRMTGFAVGFLAASRTPVEGGHFRPRAAGQGSRNPGGSQHH
ncbi:MAG: glycosyltransferase family 2 protein [Frankiales bacterium]|nr:glycosyltransferase family 2 protein [Frankiales bacterium]